MVTMILRRVLHSLITLFIVSIIIFSCVRYLPGDPILLIMMESDLSGMAPEKLEEMRAAHGLDKPIPVQYFNWLTGVFKGDLGTSIHTNMPVTYEIFRRLPITFQVGGLAILFGAVFGITMGVIAAVNRGRKLDQFVVFLTNLGITVPIFWLGLILMLVFGVRLGLLPVMGYTPPSENFVLHIRQLVMPVTCMMMFPAASVARQTRSSMLEVMHQDYVRTARSKGLKEKVVIVRHALKNGLIPVITTIGLSVPVTVGGSAAIESVFALPGMGSLLVKSVQTQDYAYVQGIVLIISAVVLIANLLIDIAYGWIDPRIRHN